jgi:hypothetical protein
MLTENENGKAKRSLSATRKPVILKMDEDDYITDATLLQMQEAMIEDNAANREFGFYNDSISQSMTEITAAVAIGSGPKFWLKNSKALDIINDFCQEINVNGRTIKDWMRSVWFDEIVHANSFWRIEVDPKLYENHVDIQRLDPKTITLVKDPHYGWRALIQSVPVYQSFRSEIQFYRNVSKSSLYLRPGWLLSGKKPYSLDITIPDRPNVVIRTSYFITPPVGSILHFITGKRFTFYFMRKFAQKHWAPFLWAQIGDPNSNFYPDEPGAMDEAITYVKNLLPQVSNWGGVALPGIINLKTLDTQSTKSAQIYRDAIELYNKEIMWGLYASMSQRDASGNELSTQRGILEAFYTFLETMRMRFANTMTRFFSKALLPAWNIRDIKPNDIRVDFDPLRKSGYLEIAQAIERLNNIGTFKDDNELRKSASMCFAHLEALTESENKPRGQELMLKMKETGGGMFGTNSQRNPQAVRSTRTLENDELASIILQNIKTDKNGKNSEESD